MRADNHLGLQVKQKNEPKANKIQAATLNRWGNGLFTEADSPVHCVMSIWHPSAGCSTYGLPQLTFWSVRRTPAHSHSITAEKVKSQRPQRNQSGRWSSRTQQPWTDINQHLIIPFNGTRWKSTAWEFHPSKTIKVSKNGFQKWRKLWGLFIPVIAGNHGVIITSWIPAISMEFPYEFPMEFPY